MSEDRLIRFVTKQLDAGLAAIDRDRRDGLKRARLAALSHQSRRGEVRLAGIAGAFHISFFARRAMLRTAALLILTVGIAYWHANYYVVELAEIDSAILTDDMPINVITDKGFDAWLKSSAEY